MFHQAFFSVQSSTLHNGLDYSLLCCMFFQLTPSTVKIQEGSRSKLSISSGVHLAIRETPLAICGPAVKSFLRGSIPLFIRDATKFTKNLQGFTIFCLLFSFAKPFIIACLFPYRTKEITQKLYLCFSNENFMLKVLFQKIKKREKNFISSNTYMKKL